MWLKNVKNNVPWIYAISDLNGKKNYWKVIKKKKNSKKSQKGFNVKRIIKRKVDELCVKWRGYKNYFNSWIDKKDIV